MFLDLRRKRIFFPMNFKSSFMMNNKNHRVLIFVNNSFCFLLAVPGSDIAMMVIFH